MDQGYLGIRALSTAPTSEEHRAKLRDRARKNSIRTAARSKEKRKFKKIAEAIDCFYEHKVYAP